MAEENGRSLTGVWNGLYSYPRDLDPVGFVAILIESGTSVSGTTHEPGGSLGISGLACASLAGRRTASTVTLTKAYDRGTGIPHIVHYDGRINEDATEIEGRWRVPGDWSGKFLMIRAGGKEEAVTTEKLEPVGEL